MKYLKLFESFDNLINIVDDIAAYIPDHTSEVKKAWIPPNGDISKIVRDELYHSSTRDFYGLGTDYVSFYTFKIGEDTTADRLTNLFRASNDIINRSKSYNLRFIILNGASTTAGEVRLFFFTEEEFKKIELIEFIKSFSKGGFDMLLDTDIMVDPKEFNVIYDDDEITAIKPKTYKAAIKYAADTKWKIAFKKNLDWINKYMSPGSYYAGINWYKSKKVTQEVNSWYRKILRLPPKRIETEIKNFVNDIPRYLLYIVIFKHVPIDDDYRKVFLLYDMDRGEYGGNLHQPSSDDYMFGNAYGDMLDASHNQVKVSDVHGNMITFKDIWNRHHNLFNRVFREIESDFSLEKDKLQNLLGYWGDKGGEYTKDELVFARNDKNDLTITKSNFINRKGDGGYSWHHLGKYNDPNFDYWEIDKEKPIEKEVPNNGLGIKDFYQTISDNVKKLSDSLGGDINGFKT